MVSKVRPQSRFSFRVRMKRLAQPLPCGARTKAGELSIPRKASSFWKRSGHVVAAVVVADGQTPGNVLRECCEVTPDTLADWLQRLETRRTGGGVDTDTFGRAVVDGDEHGGLPLAGPGRGQIGAPHLVHPVGDDGAVMIAWSPRRADARGREQPVFAH